MALQHSCLFVCLILKPLAYQKCQRFPAVSTIKQCRTVTHTVKSENMRITIASERVFARFLEIFRASVTQWSNFPNGQRVTYLKVTTDITSYIVYDKNILTSTDKKIESFLKIVTPVLTLQILMSIPRGSLWPVYGNRKGATIRMVPGSVPRLIARNYGKAHSDFCMSDSHRVGWKENQNV